MAAGFFQGFPVSTSGSRTAVAEQAGAKTQLTGLVGAGMIALMLVAFPNLLADLPQPTLAAIVIAAAMSLADIPAVRRLFQQRRTDAWLSIAAFLAVVAPRRPARASSPRSPCPWSTSSAGSGCRTTPSSAGSTASRGLHDVTMYPQAEVMERCPVYRFDAPLIFANASTFRDEIRPARRRRAAAATGSSWPPSRSPTSTPPRATCSTTSYPALDDAGTRLVFAELKDPVRAKLRAYGLPDVLGDERFYPTLGSAVKAYRAQFPGRPRSGRGLNPLRRVGPQGDAHEVGDRREQAHRASPPTARRPGAAARCAPAGRPAHAEAQRRGHRRAPRRRRPRGPSPSASTSNSGADHSAIGRRVPSVAHRPITAMPSSAGVHARPGARADRAPQPIRVVRDQDHRGRLAARAVGLGPPQSEACRRSAGSPSTSGRGVEDRAQLGVAVALAAAPPRRRAPSETLLTKMRPLTSARSTRLLAAGHEGVQGADDVVAVHAEVEGEVVAGAGGDAGEGQAALGGDRGDDRLRPVAARRREPVRAAGDRVARRAPRGRRRASARSARSPARGPRRPGCRAGPCPRRSAGSRSRRGAWAAPRAPGAHGSSRPACPRPGRRGGGRCRAISTVTPFDRLRARAPTRSSAASPHSSARAAPPRISPCQAAGNGQHQQADDHQPCRPLPDHQGGQEDHGRDQADQREQGRPAADPARIRTHRPLLQARARAWARRPTRGATSPQPIPISAPATTSPG